MPGQKFFADTIRTVKQQGVGMLGSFQEPLQKFFIFLMSDDFVPHANLLKKHNLFPRRRLFGAKPFGPAPSFLQNLLSQGGGHNLFQLPAHLLHIL